MLDLKHQQPMGFRQSRLDLLDKDHGHTPSGPTGRACYAAFVTEGGR
jgi:hypothetical protein